MRMRVWGLGLTALVALSGCRQVDSVQLGPPELLLTSRGQNAQLQAVALDAEGRTMDSRVEFESSNPEVASVDSAGQLTAHKSGEVQVLAKAGGKSARAVVQVRLPSRIEVSPKSLSLVGLGGTGNFSAKVMDELGREIPGAALSWTVDDPRLAGIVNGHVTALKVGRSTVTIAFGPLAEVVELEVSLPGFAAVALEPATATVARGEQLLLVASVKASDGSFVAGVPVTFESSDPAVASVDAGGRVLANSKGRATIIARAADKQASMRVTVKN